MQHVPFDVFPIESWDFPASFISLPEGRQIVTRAIFSRSGSQVIQVGFLSRTWLSTCSVSLHPWKQTWNLKIPPWKRRFLLETIISRFHVNFWGCTPRENFSLGVIVLCTIIGRVFLLFISRLSEMLHDIHVMIWYTLPETTPLKFNSSPLKMVVGRQAFPIGKVTFQGRAVKLRDGNSKRLKRCHSKWKRSSFNHPFSGAKNVSFREGTWVNYKARSYFNLAPKGRAVGRSSSNHIPCE